MSRRIGNGVNVIALVLLGFCSTGCSLVRDPEATSWETHREQSTLAAFLAEGKTLSQSDDRVSIELPIRIGLTFLPPAGDPSDAVPSAIQRATSLTKIREAMMSLPYVSEVAIIPDYYLEQGASGGFEKLCELSRRFDFDLLAVLASDQTSTETRNFRSLGLITIIGSDLWEGDVDKTVTVIELVMVEPTTRHVVTRVTSAAAFGDTTTLLDDWRSNRHVRRVSFDEAHEALLDYLPQELGGLGSQLETPPGQRP